jgi:poly(3-hydroxybutyrate) depolymerase
MGSFKFALFKAVGCVLLAMASRLVLPASAMGSDGCRAAQPLTSGTYNVTLNGTVREFIVRVPPTYRPYKPHRVVIALHWFGGTMRDVEAVSTRFGNGSYYGLHAIAGASTIFISPQGLSNAWFNANGDDMAFMDAIVATTDNQLCVDTTQRFVVGFSFGGSMAYAIANARGAQFRAVAVLSGTDFTPWPADIKTLPVAFFVAHGVSDPANPITKGRLMRDRFVEVNGCENQTALEPAVSSASHIKTEYRRCSSGHPVTYVAFDGVHQYSPLDANAKTSWLPSEVWNFFRSAPPSCKA